MSNEQTGRPLNRQEITTLLRKSYVRRDLLFEKISRCHEHGATTWVLDQLFDELSDLEVEIFTLKTEQRRLPYGE